MIKALPLTLTATFPIDRAISSAGGVEWRAVDSNFMLRQKPGVFIAGEILAWEAPTCGYLLQATFATGIAAAKGVERWLSGQ
jgi:predicted flavoprotein YhiN